MRTSAPSWALLLLSLLLGSCGGGDTEATSPVQLIALVPAAAPAESPGRSAPAAPQAARKDTLAGIDSNADGVRDDVEKLVYDLQMTPDGRKAVLQLARATQVALTTSTSDEAAQRNGAEMVRAQACLASQVPDFTTHLSAVRAQTLNTDLRRLAWQVFEEGIARLEFTELQGAMSQ